MITSQVCTQAFALSILGGLVRAIPPAPQASSTLGVTNTLPAAGTQPSSAAACGWTSLGCYLDDVVDGNGDQDQHPLEFQIVPSTTEDTNVNNCQTACLAHGYTLSGLEFGHQCWCDNTIQNAAAPTFNSYCNTPCFGNPNEICGGYQAMSIYEYSSATSPSDPLYGFTLSAGTLSSNVGPNKFSTDSGTTWQAFTPSPRVASISTGFGVDANQVLYWHDPSFDNGSAIFCRMPSGQLNVLFRGLTYDSDPSYPVNCQPVAFTQDFVADTGCPA